MEIIPKERANLVSVITSPLGFFALSLLIVEGFLGIVLIFSDLTADDKFWGMLIGAFLFLVVVVGVLLLVFKAPKNLTYGEHGHLEENKVYGSKANPSKKQVIEKQTSTTSPSASQSPSASPSMPPGEQE